MPRTEEISVKSKGESFEGTFEVPDSLDDPLWQTLVSDFTEHTINDLAVERVLQSLASGIRNRLEDGEAAVQAYVDSFVYGERQRRARPSAKISPEDAAEFSEDQLEILRKYGMLAG